MRDVANKHQDHPDPLVPECAHEDDIELCCMLVADKCLKSLGTRAYDKLSLLNDLKKLSPEDQTSCLEGFHATNNHWRPKMINFSWFGTFYWYDYTD